MNIKEFKDLEMVCRPIIDYLKENYNPYTSVVITNSQIKLVEDLAGIPIGDQMEKNMTNKKETAQEVPVQEQSPIKVKVNIANLNEFNALLVEVTDKLTQLKNFKFKVEVEK